MKISKTNPTDTTFPGGRGTDELVLYTPAHGASTGTNSYGSEAVVRGGVVEDTDGNDSRIPADGFVLSGHGKAGEWIIAHLPAGAEVELRGGEVVARITPRTRARQVERRLAKAVSAGGYATSAPAVRARELLTRATSALDRGDTDTAVAHLEEADVLSHEAFHASLPSPGREARGAWFRLADGGPDEAHRLVARARDLNLNMLFPETFYWSGTLNPPAADDAPPQHAGFRGWDPLRVLIDEGHRNGMQVHAWCEIFFVGPPWVEGGVPELARRHPDWVAVDRSGRRNSVPEEGFLFFCPANPAVHEYLLRQLEALARAYPLDGIQLDYIRYPRVDGIGTGFCYCAYCRKTFGGEAGCDPMDIAPDTHPGEWRRWDTWREDRVTSFVAAAHARLHAARPGITVSAAIFPDHEESLREKHQDWVRWAREGMLDLVCTMTYRNDAKGVEQVTRRNMADVGRVPLMVGLGPFLRFSDEHLVDQVCAARAAGAAGQVLFAEESLTREHRAALKAGPYRSRAEAGF